MPHATLPPFVKEIETKRVSSETFEAIGRLLTAQDNYLAGDDLRAAAQAYKAQFGALPTGITEAQLSALPDRVFSPDAGTAPLTYRPVTNDIPELERQLAEAKRIEAERAGALFGPPK